MAIPIKTAVGFPYLGVKTRDGLVKASLKSWDGIVDSAGPPLGFALIAHASGISSDTNSCATGAIDTTGANLLIVGLAQYGFGGVPSVFDNKGNTWNILTQKGGAAATEMAALAWSKPTSVGSGHIFNANGVSSYQSIYAAAFSGANVAPFDKESGAVGANSPGSLVPAVANSLAMALMSSSVAATYSVDSAFTILDQRPNIGGQSLGGALAYVIQAGGPSAINPTWSGGGTISNVMAIFKP